MLLMMTPGSIFVCFIMGALLLIFVSFLQNRTDKLVCLNRDYRRQKFLRLLY